ncbi:ankyrin repeat and SAM domain-containing 3 [Labeo rohita]|uniref:Ankyrin repeat and SAM domain-containing 3 n=1 Tax=Labeo rohita TaxID=84645 RepID=A0A498MKH1_LABRO|nr:ankyrin repeat and SAM domain-containing 3 [Labeo rohita]
MAEESTGTETPRMLENEKNMDGQSGEDPKKAAANADTPANAKKHKKKKKKTREEASRALKTLRSSKAPLVKKRQRRMSELSDEASSESDQLGASLSVWLADGGSALIGPDELNVPLDLHTACSIGQYDVVAECIRRGDVDLDGKNIGGWTPLMYAAYIGHDNIANLLLEAGVSVNATTSKGLTPLMLAASCGNESIAYFLLQGVRTEERNIKGETARSLAMMYGHTKIASLISQVMRAKSSLYEELSSSEEESTTPRVRSARSRTRGPSIHDGPQAIARFRVGSKHEVSVAPPGYVTFQDVGDQSEGMCNRDVTSPINDLDVQSNSSRDELFFDNDMPTMRSSSSSSEGLSHLLGLSREASLESNEDSDQAKRSCPRRSNKLQHSKGRSPANSSGSTGYRQAPSSSGPPPSYTGPKDLAEFLKQIGFSKYLPLLEEQDIDLRIFLTLTENDLKEVGITLFGPKRKMTSAIARWHSNARPPSDALEQAYADQLEAEMQEMAIQLHKVESLQGQVGQEKELRAVMEGCLMEEKMAWKSVQAELQENSKRIQTLSGKLHTLRNTHTQLAQVAQEDVRVAGKGDGLMCSQLLSKMESHMADLADGLKEILHSLQHLSASEKSSHNWEES